MTLFLSVFFLLYSLMHLYAFLKARAAISFGAGAGLLLALFMVVMIVAPLIVRMLERAELEAPARAAAYIGYTWLGVLFLFSSYAMAIDLYRVVLHAVGAFSHKDFASVIPSARTAFFLPLALSVFTSVYGYF